MKALFILALIILLSGCASLDMARTKAANVADESLALGYRLSCQSASVRAVSDRYWTTAAECKRWADFCFGDKMKYLVCQDDN